MESRKSTVSIPDLLSTNQSSYKSGKKRDPKPKLLGPDILWWGGGVFHVKGWGPKSSACPSKPGKPNFFGGISRDFAGMAVPEKFERKKFGFNFRYLVKCSIGNCPR